MGSAFAPLNGSGPQRIYLNCYYVSYNQAGNYSTWYWELRYYGDGYGSWGSGPYYWGLGGFAVGGPHAWSIAQGDAFKTYTVLGSGYFNKTHNAAGYLTETNLVGSIDTNHSSIGDGSVSVYPGDAPRIPKVPSAPPAPVFVSAQPDSLNFTIAAPSDNGGSTITTYNMRIVSEDGTTLIGEYTSGSSAQSTAGKVTLTPGTKYRVLYAAKNGVGYGGYSAYTMMETQAGAYVSDGTKWIGFSPKISDGALFTNLLPKVSNGSAWADLTKLLPAPEIDDLDNTETPGQLEVFLFVSATGLASRVAIQRSATPDFANPTTIYHVPSSTISYPVFSGVTPNQDWYVRAKWDDATVETKQSMWSNVMIGRLTA